MSGTVRDISRFNFFQETNEASKKLRKDSKEFINDVYTKSDRNKMSNKERNRVKKFLKDNDYDPKTGTIKTDIKDKSGKNVRVKFATRVSTDPTNKNKLTTFLPDTDDMFPNDPDPGCYIPDPNTPGDESTIVLGKSTLKRKPVILNGFLKHEEGHLAKQVYGKDFSKEERVARKLIDNSHEKMDAHDEDPEEYAVDLYGEKHNKYAKKYPGKYLNSSMTNDVKVLKKNKQTIKKFMTLIKQNVSTSVVDDLIMELEQMLSINERMRSNDKDPERQKSYEDENNDLKNTLERIKSINDEAKMKKEYTEYMKRDILRQLSRGSKCIDNGYKLRKQFVQKMINEYALDYDECVELVQEMYNDPEYLLYEIYSESDQDEINEGDEMEDDIDIELPDMEDLKSDFDDVDFDDEDDTVSSKENQTKSPAGYDLSEFGKHGNLDLPNNQYDEKEVETLNILIAAENDAMNDYFEATKSTKDPTLSKLYSDIGSEERFHAEQLLYAKSLITGEKYVPRDPEVKKEYEELISQGMDEDTAIYTTIDKMSLSQSSDEMTDEDMKNVQDDVATTESMLLQNELILDTILENANFITNKISEQYESFVEQYVYLEDVSNVSTAPKSLQKGQSPIRFIAKSFSNIIKFLMNLARRIREYMTRSRIKRDKIKRWVKNHGVKAVFEPGYSFYFYDDKTGKFNTNDALRYCDLLFKLTKQIADRCGLSLNFNNPVRINNPIGYGSIERGIELINGVVMSKTKVVITDKNESYFRHVLFGYSDTKIPMIKTENDENGDEVNKLENESFNIYNSFSAILSIISQCSKLTNEVVIAMANLEGDPNSVYRSNYSEYRKMVKNISIVVKGYNTIIKALNADLNTMLKIDNGVLEMTKAHDEADRNGQHWDGGTDDYNPNDGDQQPQQKSQTPHVTPKQTMRSRVNNNVMPSV